MKAARNPIAQYLRSRGWKDGIFLCVVLTLGAIAKHYFLGGALTDYQKWEVRPRVAIDSFPTAKKPGETGLPPCLFIVPLNAVDQHVASGSIGDCLQLVPNGKKLDVVEVALNGVVIPVRTDIVVADTVPLAFTRTYLPLNDWSRKFQVYLPNVYDLFLTGHRFPYTDVDWRLPDGESVHYGRVSPGTGYADAIFEETGFIPGFVGSRMSWNGWGWDWTMADGTTFLSPEAYQATRPQQGSLVGIFDDKGNEVHLSRNQNGDLEQIVSPSGRWIKLQYSGGHMVKAEDSSGSRVDYTYDDLDRPNMVRYSNGETTTYSYDSENRITAIEEPSRGFSLKCSYDSNDRLNEVDTGNTHGYKFQRPNDLSVDVTNSAGELAHVRVRKLNGMTYYTVGNMQQSGSQRQQ